MTTQLAGVGQSTARPPPPEGCAPAQAREWVEIVNSLPSGYFRPSDFPMLGAFCAAAAIHRECRDVIDREGLFIQGEKGYRFPNPAVAMMSQQASTMSQLSMKLRLCPSARLAKGLKEQKGVSGKRPWEDASVA